MNTMIKVPPERYSSLVQPEGLEQVWTDGTFLCQVYKKQNGVTRISVCKKGEHSALTREWDENITWQELQDIKMMLGFDGFDAVEIFPKGKDVVNVANMRHIWILDKPLPFAWRK